RFIAFDTFGPNNGGKNLALSTHDLCDCYESGFKTTVARNLSSYDNLMIEGGFLGFHNWDEERAVRDPDLNQFGVAGTLASAFTNFGRPNQVQGFDFNNFAAIGFSSDLDSFELNVRHRTGLMCGCIETSMCYGIRYLQLDEAFFYHQISAIPI